MEVTDGRTGGAAPDDEGTLIARASAGDDEAFRTLYLRYVGDVMAFLARRVPHDVAEDLASETFVRAHQALPSFEWRGTPLRAWLVRIAYHQLVARSRRASSRELPFEEVALAVVAPGPERAVAQGEEADELRAALKRLPEQQQLAVELRYLREFSVGEAAIVLGISEEAVRAATYRGLRTLRGILQGAIS